jgi:proline iminopeptidase
MTNPVETLFPEIEPYQQGWLQVSPVHTIYYEQCGNPDGQPVVVLHGGPGSGCNPMQRRFFDPHHYRIILLDQRGCKRSLPLGGITENTTHHLADDLELLRNHLGIARWLVFGGSWGSTLALAYASRHHPAITGMILRGIFLCRESELDWFLYKARHFFPEAWEQMTAPLTADERSDILQAYYRRVSSEETTEALAAALCWNTYEASIMSLLPMTGNATPPDDATAIGRARVQLHYLVNAGFLKEHPLLTQVEQLRHIPAVIVQGRYDMVCPPVSAYELHHAWPEARFVIVPDAGHSATEPGIVAALLAATESFKQG